MTGTFKLILPVAATLALEAAGAECPSSSTGSAARVTDGSSGFTNVTGFDAESDSAGKCVDICDDPVSRHVPDGKNATYDWDYLVMDHIYVPQMCHALSQAGGEHDPTLTNVPGSKCNGRLDAPVMSIHGLWPNYYHDFAGCCQGPPPLDAGVTSAWRPETLAEMRSKWIDVAVDDGCDVCFTWNHEWQKHGMCFTDTPEKYFEAGLALHNAAEHGVHALGDFLQAHAGSTLTVAEVQQLYSQATGSAAKINMICDPQSSLSIGGVAVPFVSEFTTCWVRKPGVFMGTPVTVADLDPIDCPPAFSGSLSGPCDETFAVIGPGIATV